MGFPVSGNQILMDAMMEVPDNHDKGGDVGAVLDGMVRRRMGVCVVYCYSLVKVYESLLIS